MYRVEILVTLQDLGDLSDAVLASVQNNDVELSGVAALTQQVVDQLLIVGGVGVNDHELVANCLFSGRGSIGHVDA